MKYEGKWLKMSNCGSNWAQISLKSGAETIICYENVFLGGFCVEITVLGSLHRKFGAKSLIYVILGRIWIENYRFKCI